jgi:predicted AAA+ superfamily ATPase
MIDRPVYTKKLGTYIDSPLIKVLTGLRRSGKSSLLSLLRTKLTAAGIPPERIAHINFERLDYIDVTNVETFAKLAKNLLAEGRRYLLFDEIQNITGWERVVNGLLAENKVDIYITGSSSKLLSSELSTHITGRFVNIPVSTLSFAEAMEFKKARGAELKDIADEFAQYLQKGGFPIAHTADYSLEQIDDIVADIYASLIFRDLVERNGIRNIELLNRVIKFIFDNIGNVFSAKRVSDFLRSEKRKLNIETVYAYLRMLTNIFAIHKVGRYDARGKEALKTQEKYYLGDHSLLFAVNGRQLSHISGILENVVYQELRRKGFAVYIGKNGGREIDFIAKKPGKTLYLQVAARLDTPRTIEREFSAFAGIGDSYPKYVLSLDRDFGENRDGIEQRYLPEFLLEL